MKLCSKCLKQQTLFAFKQQKGLTLIESIALLHKFWHNDQQHKCFSAHFLLRLDFFCLWFCFDKSQIGSFTWKVSTCQQNTNLFYIRDSHFFPFLLVKLLFFCDVSLTFCLLIIKSKQRVFFSLVASWIDWKTLNRNVWIRAIFNSFVSGTTNCTSNKE